MPKKCSIPLVYEIIYRKLEKTSDNNNKVEKKISITETTNILARIFHIPKEYHYGVLRELEEMNLIEINRGSIRIEKKLKWESG